MAPVSTKFDLFLNNMMESIPRFATLCAITLAENTPQDGATEMVGGKPITVTPQDLKKAFRFSASVSSDEANPQMQTQKAQQWAQFVMQLPMTQQAIQAGDFRSTWHLAQNVGRAMRIRDKDAVLGPEPPSPDAMALVGQAIMQVAQMMTQGMASGMPPPSDPQQLMQMPGVAYAIITALQQAAQMPQTQTFNQMLASPPQQQIPAQMNGAQPVGT
jgi:hypothetical protein